MCYGCFFPGAGLVILELIPPKLVILELKPSVP